ncbi:TIGR04282 family arsenosugar biosynthesis glycosyltransferase [Oceanospirillum sanctuarii]|uniref:TIGR04282 family arsenosugar biosynthesis glycosyltransferase n=1 Tax=Oceanospirillum sanctuarii TaxID=1434821 RepID=UPI000A3B1B4F|nr:TIGR04282 family arsenosugar biosynthesis glycosyltransferase [Oceanospirillum sanctuarii]
MKRLIIQFAKEPVQGKVKTRLLSGFEPEETVDLHCELVLATAETLLNSDCDELQLHIGGDTRHPFFARLSDQGIILKPQVEGDLGRKMLQSLNGALHDFDQVLLVGSDCPALSPEVFDQAFQAFEAGNDLVLNPAEDGGYVLIGCQKNMPDMLFSGISWGTESVLRQTLANAETLGVSVALLPELWDVDYPEDVNRWRRWQNDQQGAA